MKETFIKLVARVKLDRKDGWRFDIMVKVE
jgi:hypothetical protein